MRHTLFALLFIASLVGCATLRETPDHDAVTPHAVAILAHTYEANGLPPPPIAAVRWEVGYYVEGSDRPGATDWNGHACIIRLATAPLPEPGPWSRQEREPGGFISSTALAHEVLHCALCARGDCDAEHRGNEWQFVWWGNQALAMAKL